MPPDAAVRNSCQKDVPITGDPKLGLLAYLTYYENTLRTSRYAHPKRLVRYGAKAYSQNDEDGILQELFSRIGTTNRQFVEFGVQGGGECNSLLLLTSGRPGTWLDAESAFEARIRDRFGIFLSTGQLGFQLAQVTVGNVNQLFAAIHPNLDLLSIDIDYNDNWVREALTVIWPRVVAIEHSESLKPPLSLAAPYGADNRWTGDNYFGASLKALENFGCSKGYKLVSAENHYEPPRYFMQNPVGHRPGIGRYVQI